jgi:hypothetical protein
LTQLTLNKDVKFNSPVHVIVDKKSMKLVHH